MPRRPTEGRGPDAVGGVAEVEIPNGWGEKAGKGTTPMGRWGTTRYPQVRGREKTPPMGLAPCSCMLVLPSASRSRCACGGGGPAFRVPGGKSSVSLQRLVRAHEAGSCARESTAGSGWLTITPIRGWLCHAQLIGTFKHSTSTWQAAVGELDRLKRGARLQRRTGGVACPVPTRWASARGAHATTVRFMSGARQPSAAGGS